MHYLEKIDKQVTKTNFDDFVKQNSSCLEKVNGNLELKKSHSYHYQVQQQFFSAPNYQYDDFILCAIDKAKNIHLFVQCIHPDAQHWKFDCLNTILENMHSLRDFGIIVYLKVHVPFTLKSKDVICFCRTEKDDDSILCCNKDCLY